MFCDISHPDNSLRNCAASYTSPSSTTTHCMSLQVNLSSREIADAYQDVLSSRGIDWVVLAYEKGSNDLKVQATGSGGLEELEEEFSDGR